LYKPIRAILHNKIFKEVPNMRIVRFSDPELGVRLGLLLGDDVYDITEITGSKILGIQDLWSVSGGDIVSFIEKEIMPKKDNCKSFAFNELDIAPKAGSRYLLKAVDAQEVWAAGVTYARSRDAREYETKQKSVYDRVYDAVRPEIFFKATPRLQVGPYEPVGLRSDATWNVPEPELGLVIGEKGKIIGYIIGNDMSSRDIEGENPLYLPQAKVYNNCCALGPIIALAHEGFDATSLTIHCRIIRDGVAVFDDSAKTSQLKRTFSELVGYLTRDNSVPVGTVLLTGTCVVPEADFTLKEGDVIEISIDNLGTLRNVVKQF